MYSITYVLVHMQRKRKKSFKGFAFFVCVNHVGQKTVYAAAKNNVSWDIEELLGWPCLLFLFTFPLCEFGPVWNLELPNLKVKEAVFLPYFPAYEMTLTFDTILDKPHLATTQVAIAYFKSNTSKDKDTMGPLFFVKDTAADVACEQALRLGEKIARRGKGKGKRGLFTFPSPQFPARLKACSKATGDMIWLDVFLEV